MKWSRSVFGAPSARRPITVPRGIRRAVSAFALDSSDTSDLNLESHGNRTGLLAAPERMGPTRQNRTYQTRQSTFNVLRYGAVGRSREDWCRTLRVRIPIYVGYWLINYLFMLPFGRREASIRFRSSTLARSLRLCALRENRLPQESARLPGWHALRHVASRTRTRSISIG